LAEVAEAVVQPDSQPESGVGIEPTGNGFRLGDGYAGEECLFEAVTVVGPAEDDVEQGVDGEALIGGVWGSEAGPLAGGWGGKPEGERHVKGS
jgi:hypothetical protein